MSLPASPDGASSTRTGHQTCPFCGGVDVVPGIRLNQRAEVGAIGLPYKTGFLVVGTEPLCADLCPGCGTVLRLYVKDLSRRWIRN